MPYMVLQRAISAVTAGVTKLRMRAAGEDQVEPLALTLPGTPSRKLIRAAPASMPAAGYYMYSPATIAK